MDSKRAVVVLSGGMDSTTLLYWLLNADRFPGEGGYQVHALTVHYGQRHQREISFARKVCHNLGVDHRVLDLSGIRSILGGSALTSDIEVPEGHYEEESMKMTVVPNRNMILLSMAIGWAIHLGAGTVAYGAHQGDHAIYPDCRSDFVGAMAAVANLCHYERIQLLCPFLTTDKTGIVKIGTRLGVHYQDTWTCYKGEQLHCGKCGSCQERRESFREAGVEDPTVYQGEES